MANKRTAHVIVLGDLSRSPRILSQAHFLARDVNSWSSSVKPLDIPVCPDLKTLHLPSFLVFIFKFIFIALSLFLHLVKHCRSELIIIQNPPAVPTFLITWIFIKITGKSLVIDWHNYGFTLLELNASSKSLFTRLYYTLEVGFAKAFFSSSISDRVAHLCVSKALQRDLETKGIQATVYYDRAPDGFVPTSSQAAHRLFLKLSNQYEVFRDELSSCRFTRFTELTALPSDSKNNGPKWRPDRPALVVSSCSWTPDDDFGLVIDALCIYDEIVEQSDSGLPHVVFAVTGRGPLKSYYQKLVKEKKWKHVEVIMPWLEWSDYPIFLGCADLGISIHRSSSGLDLPMKVVDLFGVNVPVLALSYPTLCELMDENNYGLCFETCHQLVDQMCSLLKPCQESTTKHTDESSRFLSVGSGQLIYFRESLKQRNKSLPRGFTYWKNTALPVYLKVVSTAYHANKAD
uniref:Chitobiosyldiphosphodolichol beta-mannosyltransferase n=1 Tax=Trichobilharzia regenti TaxID=157069 RepID=A0AA85KJK0_TRIRE|nr:unnamed protein product [Trichobilharzia regenti]